MDCTLVCFAIVLCLAIISQPGTKNFVKNFFIPKVNKTRCDRKSKCVHTIGDCRDCTLSLDCPMKNEYLVVVPKDDEYDN